MIHKHTTQSFIEKAKKMHGNTYSYHMTWYKNGLTKVFIVCKIHGLFKQSPVAHTNGSGCPKCSFIRCTTNKIKSIEDTLKDFYIRHGNKYSYDKIYTISYTSGKSYLPIFCNTHHQYFDQTIENHTAGKGCPLCALDTLKNKFLDSTEDLINKFQKVHGNIYDYSNVVSNGHHSKVEIKCTLCNKVFYQMPTDHIRGNGCTCHKESKGEKLIKRFLDLNGIQYNSEYNFNKLCRNPITNRVLYFDFYLPDYKLCIEYDGAQHFIPYNFNSLTKNKQELIEGIQYRDSIKNEFCDENNINLLRIPYTELKNINTILEQALL